MSSEVGRRTGRVLPRARSERDRAIGRRWVAWTGLTLLIADLDDDLRESDARLLDAAGVSVVRCGDGADALVRFGQVAPDAVVLPAALGPVDAGTVVTTIRRWGSTPVLLGVARSETDTAGPAVLAGAAAIVARPYVAEEILQHLDQHLPDIDSRLRLSCGPLQLDPRAYSVRLHGRELSDLPLKEFELLRFLMMHADQVVTSEQIREALWGGGDDIPSSNTVAVHIARLRARIGGSELLRTVRGLGYRLVVPEVAGVTEPR